MRTWSKRTVYDLHLKKINPCDIRVPCIQISKSDILFEQNQEKYDVEVLNDDVIKRNQIFFNFMQRTFNCLYGLYLRQIYLLMDAIIKIQLRVQSAAGCRRVQQSAAEIEKMNREKKARNTRKEGTSKPSPKNPVL